jgi:creatinine amidohydrolase
MAGTILKPLLRELMGTTPAHVFLCNWFRALTDEYAKIFEHREDHAGELETSMGLAYFPHLVARREDGSLIADQGETKPTASGRSTKAGSRSRVPGIC